MEAQLFSDRIYRDADYAAAADFCRELIPFAPDDLLPGTTGANFCPIARTLDAGSLCEIPADLTGEWIEGNGGSVLLFSVGAKAIQLPAVDEWSFDLISDDLSEAEIEALLKQGYEYDESGGEMLRRTVPIPPDVMRFIDRFDAGEFPSLHLPTEIESEDYPR